MPKLRRDKQTISALTSSPGDTSTTTPDSENTTETTETGAESTIQIPVIPTFRVELRRITEDLAWLILGNMLAEGNKFTLDRGQCVELGSALIKMGNAMPRRPELEVVESGLILPG